MFLQKVNSFKRHPFSGLPRTTWVSQTDLHFNEARDDRDGVALALAGSYANHLHLAADG